MLNKYNVFLLLSLILLSSCANTWDQVKRGLTGQKKVSTDEFLIEKKDPLVLPPEFEKLPSPDAEENQEFSEIEEQKISIQTSESIEEDSVDTSTEQSILRKINRK